MKVDYVGKGRMGSRGFTQTIKNKKRGRDYTNEALATRDLPKLLMNLWQALLSGLSIELNLSKMALKRVFNLNISINHWTLMKPKQLATFPSY